MVSIAINELISNPLIPNKLLPGIYDFWFVVVVVSYLLILLLIKLLPRMLEFYAITGLILFIFFILIKFHCRLVVSPVQILAGNHIPFFTLLILTASF